MGMIGEERQRKRETGREKEKEHQTEVAVQIAGGGYRLMSLCGCTVTSMRTPGAAFLLSLALVLSHSRSCSLQLYEALRLLFLKLGTWAPGEWGSRHGGVCSLIITQTRCVGPSALANLGTSLASSMGSLFSSMESDVFAHESVEGWWTWVLTGASRAA